MEKTRVPPPIATAECSMVRALEVVGERWVLLLLRQAFYGVRRFDEIQAELGVSRKVLAERLERMVAGGLLRRVPYREPGQRTRQEYRLTEKGEALAVVLVALMQWGDRFLPSLPRGRPLRLRDRASGQAVRAALVREDGAEVARRDLQTEFWPDQAEPPCAEAAGERLARAGGSV